MTAKMSKAEYEGYLKKYRLNHSDVSHLILMKTGAVISPNSLWVQADRKLEFSATMTALLRLLFRMLDDVHEKTV